MRNSAVLPAALAGLVSAMSAAQALAQVNSGSDGSDGALNPTSNLIIDMADHPDGIYQYTSVSIPSGITVSFTPNAANTPVVWLVQGSCMIAGTVNISGTDIIPSVPGTAAGPGGGRGGSGALGAGQTEPGPGFGPGGGKVTPGQPTWYGGAASFGTQGPAIPTSHPPGNTYGNSFLLPLLGGSGGGGGAYPVPYSNPPQYYYRGGGGGGGALLIAASNTITLSGTIRATGGGIYNSTYGPYNIAGGSGGAVRLVATTLTGAGSINANGGLGDGTGRAGQGRVRLEAFSDTFTGSVTGVTTRGLTGIILLPSNQEPRLVLSSVAGTAIPNPPTGGAATPDVIIPGEQANPITIVVACQNIPLNSDIILDVKPYNGAGVTATGQNTTGTPTSSTATILMDMPTGGGTIQARTTANLVLASAKDGRRTPREPALFETGLAMNGERFRVAEITATLAGRQELVFVTESGKRIAASAAGRNGAERKPSTRPS